MTNEPSNTHQGGRGRLGAVSAGEPAEVAAPEAPDFGGLALTGSGVKLIQEAGVGYCPERGFFHPKLTSLGPHDAAIIDVPMDSPDYRKAFIQMVREMDFSASIGLENIDRAALAWYGGREGIKQGYSARDRPDVPVQGLAGGHTLAELVEGCKLEGAQGLVAVMPNPKHPGWHLPVAYLNYWTDVIAPHHMGGLLDLVRDQLGPKEKFALADTVVCLPAAPKGMYRALLAHATLEFFEKARSNGISKIFDIVRLSPNPNPAIKAHETLGWEVVKGRDGESLELFEDVVSEALGLTVPGHFQVVCLDLKSPKIAEQLAIARKILGKKNILTLDLDGCGKTFISLGH